VIERFFSEIVDIQPSCVLQMIKEAVTREIQGSQGTLERSRECFLIFSACTVGK
jgi:hypothetical protein